MSEEVTDVTDLTPNQVIDIVEAMGLTEPKDDLRSLASWTKTFTRKGN